MAIRRITSSLLVVAPVIVLTVKIRVQQALSQLLNAAWHDRYGRGAGLQLWVNGVLLASTPHLERLEATFTTSNTLA